MVDGNSLTCEQLLQLSRGQTRIKVAFIIEFSTVLIMQAIYSYRMSQKDLDLSLGTVKKKPYVVCTCKQNKINGDTVK